MMAYVFVEPAALVEEGGWLALLMALSVKGALVLIIAAMTAWGLRRAAAASRHLVWGMGLASLLVLPLLSVALPAWQWPIVPDGLLAQGSPSAPPPTPAVVQPSAIPADDSLQPTGTRANESNAARHDGLSVRSREAMVSVVTTEAPNQSPAARTAIAASTERHAPDEARSGQTRSRWNWIQWAVIGWLIGAALIVAHLLVGTARIWHLTRRAEAVRDTPWLMLVDDLSRRLALTQAVALRRSARVTMPMACGLFRPSILLPSEADDWSRERREVVLLHELAHVKRRDCLTQLLAQVACATYWFNPLVWVAARRLRIERERACDDQVLDAGAKASDYADHLLDIARSMGARPTALMAAVAIARRSQLEGRLLAILDPRLRRRALNRSSVTWIAIVMICLVLPLAMLRPAVGAQTKRARPAPRPPAVPQAPASPIVAAPAAPALMAAPPDAPLAPEAVPAPAEPGVPPEAMLAPPAAPPAPEAAPSPAAAPPPVPAVVPQSPAPPQSPISQQDKDAAVEAFRDALKDDNPEMREQALFALSQISGRRATETIITALKDSNPQVRERAAWALGMRQGDGLVDALIAALKDANAGVREQAAWALGMKGDGRAIDALTAALRDDSDEVREKAAWALGLKGNSRAVEPLIEALKDKSAEVRGMAAWALGIRGDARAIKALNAASKDENREVRSKALWALGMLLVRRGEAITVSGEGDNDNHVDVDVGGKVRGGVSGGIRGGVANGVSGGVAGGVLSGVSGGVGAGVAAGIASGVGHGVGAGFGGVTTRGRKVRRPASGASSVKPTTKQP